MLLSLGEGVNAIADLIQAALFFALYAALFGGAFTIAAWLSVFVWVYFFLPPSSALWVWWRAGLLGAAVGVVFVSAPFLLFVDSNPWSLVAFAPSAALTGAVSAAFAALTRPLFFKP